VKRFSIKLIIAGLVSVTGRQSKDAFD